MVLVDYGARIFYYQTLLSDQPEVFKPLGSDRSDRLANGVQHDLKTVIPKLL